MRINGDQMCLKYILQLLHFSWQACISATQAVELCVDRFSTLFTYEPKSNIMTSSMCILGVPIADGNLKLYIPNSRACSLETNFWSYTKWHWAKREKMCLKLSQTVVASSESEGRNV